MPLCDSSELCDAEFRFRNIGPIVQADLTLGGLTVIAGRNNTGKTYLVYTLYGFLKRFSQAARLPIELRPEMRAIASQVEEISVGLQNSGQARHAMDEKEFRSARETALDRLARSFSEGELASVFSSDVDAFQDASLEVRLPAWRTRTLMRIDTVLPGGAELSVQYVGNEIVASLDRFPSRIPSRVIRRHVAQILNDLLLEDLPQAPFILSAERFGISLFYRELDFTKSKIVDLLQRRGDGKDSERDFPFLLIDRSTSRYALPIKDNIDYTRSIPDLKRQRSEIYEDKMFDEIKDMMAGYYASSDGDIHFVSKARGRRRFNIPLHLASSSARGLSDLYFFLRHVARKDQLLIIDEPESHLDTTNQREMARLLARFVRAGIKVLITTHSDYIIKEFNNLIMLGSEFENRESVAKRLGYSADEYLPQESVRAYVAEKNTLTRCAVDRFGMDMPVFDKSIDKINRVANELSSRVEEID